MVRVIPTRSQLGYANGSAAPITLTEGEPVSVPDDLAKALLSGGDAILDEPRAGNPSSDVPLAPPADPEPGAGAGLRSGRAGLAPTVEHGRPRGRRANSGHIAVLND